MYIISVPIATSHRRLSKQKTVTPCNWLYSTDFVITHTHTLTSRKRDQPSIETSLGEFHVQSSQTNPATGADTVSDSVAKTKFVNGKLSRFLKRLRSFLNCSYFQVKNDLVTSEEPTSRSCILKVAIVVVVCDRAGHFRYFFNFSIIKDDFFAFFIKLTTYFCTSPI